MKNGLRWFSEVAYKKIRVTVPFSSIPLSKNNKTNTVQAGAGFQKALEQENTDE